MTHDLQIQYFEHVWQTKVLAYEAEARYRRLDLETRLQEGNIPEHLYRAAIERINNRHPNRSRIPDKNDPQFWQKLPLSAAERAGFTEFCKQAVPRSLTPKERSSFVRSEIERLKLQDNPPKDFCALLALAHTFPSMVSDEQLLQAFKEARCTQSSTTSC